MASENKGIFLCITAGLFWGGIGIFVKKISGFSPLGIACFRLLIAFMGMIMILSFGQKWREIKLSFFDWRYFFPLSFLMSIHFILSVTGYHGTTVANASILNNTMPLFVPLFALAIHERTNKAEWTGILLGLSGIFFIFSSQVISFSSEHFLGNLASLFAAVLLSIYTILGRRLRQKYSFLTIMFWVFGGGGIFIFLESLLLNQPLLLRPTSTDLVYLLGLGIFGTLAGHTLFNAGLKYVKASVTGLLTLISPISATIYALVFFREVPQMGTLLGLFFSLAGIATVVLSHGQGRVARKTAKA